MSQIVRSQDGDVIVGWRSARQNVPFNNIYLQKLDPQGRIQWETDGTPLSPYPANQNNFSMIGDGYGGVVVVWEDYRFGSDYPAIYAQRINLRGEPLWGRDGARICAMQGAQRKPKVVSDLKDGFFVVWEDSRKGINESDIYAQYLDLGGKTRWLKAGMPIVTSPNLQQNFAIASDEKHYLYIIWEDFRNGLYWNLYAQKLDREGNFFWKAGGLDIFAGVEESHQQPDIVPDGYGGLLFVYQKYSDETHGTDIYRGRIAASGELLFHFATCYSQDEQLNPRIVKKGSKALLCWEDRRYGNWDLYAQMIRLKDGILEWDVNGVPVVKTPSDERNPVVISSTSYGYQVFSWLRKEGNSTRIFVQKLNNLGEPAWELRGKEICQASDRQLEPAILPDDKGGLWCTWSDRREAGTAHVYAQRVDGRGLLQLPQAGLRLAGAHKAVEAEIRGVKVIAARNGHFFVVWEDYRNGIRDSDIYIQKIDSKGNAVWRRGGIPVCIAKGEQNRPILVDDGVGGVIIAWMDSRGNRNDDVYAQRINSWGKMLWRYNGVLVCGAAGSQSSIRGVSDGKEGVVLCWVDARTVATTGFDLYIQRVSYEGETLWGENGKPFARYSGLQTSPSLVGDDNGGAYIAWMDSRAEFSNIYVQHINEFGIYEWEYGGRCLVPISTNQRHPQMVRNFENDLYIVWQEGRFGDGYEKLFMQCISPNGTKLWGRSGKLVCDYPGRQSYPQVTTDQYGHFWVSWLDERTVKQTGVRLLTQKFDIGGTPQWQPEGIYLGESMEEFSEFEIVINGKGYTYYTWNQIAARGTKNVFYQKLYPDGRKKYDYGGVRLGGDADDQKAPSMAINADGQVLISWTHSGHNGEKFGIIAKMIGE